MTERELMTACLSNSKGDLSGIQEPLTLFGYSSYERFAGNFQYVQDVAWSSA